jgi:hypothetical protein
MLVGIKAFVCHVRYSKNYQRMYLAGILRLSAVLTLSAIYLGVVSFL